MRMKSLILIFIALGCGLVASIGISQVMNRGGGGGTNLEMEQILVALNDIDINSKLGAQNVRLEDWPKAKVPDGAIRRLEDVKDKYANARFFKGEPIHVSKVTDQLGNIASKVPAGYRAMPVKVEEDTVMKAISPGDRVDVMVFLRRNPPEISETGAFTILKNVRVFAINTNTERATDAKGESTNFRTISLLIKEDHAGELVVASKMGNIFLTLRRPDEKDDVAGESVTPIKDILSGKSRSGSEPDGSTSPGAGENSPLGVVRNQGTAAPPTTPETEVQDPAAPAWRLDIFTPAGRQQFEWADAAGLPVQTLKSEANQLNSPPTAPAPAPRGSRNSPPAPPAPEGTNSDQPAKDHSAPGTNNQPTPNKDDQSPA